MNSKDNSPTNPKSPSEHTKLSRLNDLGEPSLKHLEGTTRLAGQYKGSETSKSTESKYPENTFNDRSKHDALMRKALENPIVAKEFFDMHLPKEIKAMFSSYTLKMEKESFVEADLKHSISDILFSGKFKDDTGYLWILLEHQSTPDHFMAFRLFKYMTDIAARHLTLNPKSKHLPFVYPLALLHK